jgi:hypothetical protein
VHLAKRSDGAVGNPAGGRANVLAGAGRQEMRRDLCLAGGLDDDPGLTHAVGQRLVHHDLFALPHRGNGDNRMKVVWRHHLDRVDVLAVLQQVAEVGV